jgi:hypothetical protein
MENYQIYLIILAVVIGILIYLWSEDKLNTDLSLSLPKTKIPNIDFMPILYIIGLTGVVWFIASSFYPGFWGRYYGSDLFWPSVIAMIFCLYMWSQKYFLFMFLFFAILILVLSRFGDFGTEKAEKEEILIVEILNKETGQRHIAPVSKSKPWRGSPKFQFRITPPCGKSIKIYAPNWDRYYEAHGCTNGIGQMPFYKKWIEISIL